MKTAKQLAYPLLAAVIFLVCMIAAEQILAPPYAVKSALKLALILLLTGIGIRLSGKDWKTCIRFRKMQHPAALIAFMIAVIPAVLLGFFLLRNQLDLPSIRQGLMEKEQLTRQNCLFVFAYIALCNSFLEEYFFRRFAFLELRERWGRLPAYLFSSFSFAAYHIAMMIGWFSPSVFVLTVTGLAIGGAVFDFLDEKSGGIMNSWMVHMFANLAINTVGCILMGIL